LLQIVTINNRWGRGYFSETARDRSFADFLKNGPPIDDVPEDAVKEIIIATKLVVLDILITATCENYSEFYYYYNIFTDNYI
jgi:predicted nucleic acid-binding protein